MLYQFMDEGPPEAFVASSESEHRGELIFGRILELQIEQCDSLQLLCRNGMFRPAYAGLRSILENMSALVWVALDVKRFGGLLEEGKQPNIRAILTRIGWEKEYVRTFSFLSGFVHIDMTHADLYRNYQVGGEVEGGQEVTPEITPESEMYIIETPRGFLPLSINRMSPEEIENEYAPYLVAKTFDLNLTGIRKLYGSVADTRNWWPRDAIELFSQMCRDFPEIGRSMLWFSD